jgi:hypothetical protein
LADEHFPVSVVRQCDWQVKQVEEKEFTAVFPEENTLETISRISEILMSIHWLKVKILKSNFDPEAVEMLQIAWVKIYGLPLFMKLWFTFYC